MPKHRRNDFTRELDCFAAEPIIEPYLDDELSGSEIAALEKHLDRCESCRAELELARRIQTGLHELPPLACPPQVSRAVFEHADTHPPLMERFRRFWGDRHVLQGAFAMLLVAALGVAHWRATAPPVPPPPEVVYTEEEIAQAKAELEFALAYLGNIGQKAQKRFSSEVGDRVVAPFTRSIAGALFLAPPSAPVKDEADAG